MKKGKKVSILGAGNVGATIAYTLTMDGMCSEIVLVDINEAKAKGEAMDILQGTALCPPVNIYASDYSATKDSDIVIITLGMARKPGMTRIDLAQNNVNIIKSVMPQVTKYAPDAIYVVVSNPVDILTYAILKITGLPESQVIGSGTLLDSSRLRAGVAEHIGLNPKNIHGFVLGEHGDSSMVPWSLVTIGGMPMATYCKEICGKDSTCGHEVLLGIENDMRTAGAKVISLKGATFYAVALSTRRICECIVRDTRSIVAVSSMLHGQYGIDDVCLSLPAVVGACGIEKFITPPMTDDEVAKLRHSGDVLKGIISSIEI